MLEIEGSPEKNKKLRKNIENLKLQHSTSSGPQNPARNCNFPSSAESAVSQSLDRAAQRFIGGSSGEPFFWTQPDKGPTARTRGSQTENRSAPSATNHFCVDHFVS